VAVAVIGSICLPKSQKTILNLTLSFLA